MWEERERSPALAAPGSNDLIGGLIASSTTKEDGAKDDELQAPSKANDLCDRYRPLALKIAASYRGRGIELEDLKAAGVTGLVIASRKFKPDRGDFAGYARHWIKGEIRALFKPRPDALASKKPKSAKAPDGAGTGISGFRANLGVGDDLFGSREDAYSETVRQKRWDWYQDDFSARLKPGAKRILMNTRWHEEDVAGRVLEQIERKEIKGRVISIPAIAEENDSLGRKPGEFLWDDPGGYNYAAFLRSRQRETSPMMWAALYQQRPAPEEGDYFKADWLKSYDTRPARETLRVYGGSDYAVMADGGDYTVHIVVGIDPDGRMYLLDLWRKQTASDEWIEAFCDLLTDWKPVGWAEEKGQISAGVGPALDKRQRERQAFCFRQQFPTRGDKAVRAQSIRGRMALEGLHVPTSASWYSAFRSELLSFPAGKHDDQVDALGLIGQLLDQMVPGQKPRQPEKPKVDIGYRPMGFDEQPLDWRMF